MIHLGVEPGFRHPLVRAAVYHEAPTASRRAAHRALAAAATGDQAAETRAGHLASAATGPDPTVAQALADAGRTAGDRGAWQTAMTAYRRAAQFTTDPKLRTAHLLAAAQAALLASAPSAAEIAVSAAATPDPLVRAQAHRILATLWNINGDARRAASLLIASADRIAALDAEFSMLLRLDAAAFALHCGDYELADSVAHDAVERSAALGGELLLAARVAQGWVRFCRAEADPAEPFGVPVAEVTARIPTGPGVLPFPRSPCPGWSTTTRRGQCSIGSKPTPPGTSHPTCCRSPAPSTRTSRSVPAGGPSASPPRRTPPGSPATWDRNIRARALALLAQYAAAMGRSDECERYVTEAVEIAQSTGLMPIEVFGAPPSDCWPAAPGTTRPWWRSSTSFGPTSNHVGYGIPASFPGRRT